VKSKRNSFCTGNLPVTTRQYSTQPLTALYFESQTQTYYLEEFTEETVRFLTEWIYTQNIGPLEDEQPEVLLWGPFGDLAFDRSLAELWVLADKLCMPLLQNLVIDRLESRQLLHDTIPVSIFEYVYNNTSEDSLLRKYLVDVCVFGLAQESYKSSKDEFPVDMLVDIAVASAMMIDKLKLSNELPRPRWDLTVYHVSLNRRADMGQVSSIFYFLRHHANLKRRDYEKAVISVSAGYWVAVTE